MKAIKQKMKVLRQYLHYGEIKHLAIQNNIDPERASEIARGRISPRPNEIQFALDIINTTVPRIEQFKRLDKVPMTFAGDAGATMGMSY